MVEMNSAVAVPQAEIAKQPERGHMWRNVAAVFVAGGVALTACSSGGHESKDPTSTTVAVSDAMKNVENCYDHTNFSANLADHNFATPEGFFPSTSDTVKGNEVLNPASVAKQKYQAQICNDTRALAAGEAVRELRDAKQLPSAGTISRINQLASLYHTNKQAADAAAKRVYQTLEFIEPTQTFAVTKGQATQVEAVRDKSQKLTGYKASTVTSTGSFEGFVLDYNHDDKSLTADQRALLDKLRDLVLFDAQSGTIIFNNLQANGSFSFETNKQQTPVTPNTEQNAQLQAGGNNVNQNQNAQGQQNHNSGNQGGNGGGQFGNVNGTGESNQPGSVPEQGGQGGHQPGKQPSFGGGQGGGETPGTKPPETTPPKTTPPTTPPQTTPPKTTPPTTPPVTKGPAPCDPNIAKC